MKTIKAFLQAMAQTAKGIFGDAGVLLLVVIAPVIYGLYYPLPYSSEIVRHVPVAVVDYAQDSLSRQLIRFVSASPTLKVRVLADERQAEQQLLDDQVMALMVIPHQLQRTILSGGSASINMIGNGNYILASKNAQQAMADAILALSADIEINRLKPLGLGKTKIQAIHDPVTLSIQPLHNRNEGYGSYVVPAVAWLILQQTLLIGCALMVSTWMEKRQAYAAPAIWFGRLLMISLVHYVICLGYTGLMFDFWGYETGGNSSGNLLLIALFSPCVAIIGCLLGLLIKDRERTMQLLVFSALPMYFVSGFSWPTQLLPEVLQYLRWLFPSTSAIRAGLSFNQLGGTIADNMDYLVALATIAWVGLILLLWFGRERDQHGGGKNS